MGLVQEIVNVMAKINLCMEEKNWKLLACVINLLIREKNYILYIYFYSKNVKKMFSSLLKFYVCCPKFYATI